jgi:hypothetical protein
VQLSANKKGFSPAFLYLNHKGTAKVQIFNKETTTKAKQTDSVKH